MVKEPYKLSAKRLKELQEEQTYLNTTRRKEVDDAIQKARSFGDLPENSEYRAAKEEQGKLQIRLDNLEEILSNYVVIEEDETEDDC